MKKTTPKPITIKLFKTSDKEKTLKAARGRHIMYRENKEKNDNMVDAIKNGGSSPIPSSQIIYNQAILDGIARSAELGCEVKIEIPEI